MSVVSKVQELGKMRKRGLVKLREDVEIKQQDIELEKDELARQLVEQRAVIVECVESKDADKEKIERLKLDNLEKTYKEKLEIFRDNLETLKAIDQIFKMREERKSAVCSRLYGALGLVIAGGGVVLAYGSDTIGTLFNKKTYDAAKSLFVRFLPKP